MPLAELFQAEFWRDATTQAAHWLVTSLPSILVIVALGVVLVKSLTYGLAQLNKLLVRRGEEDALPAEEVRKRVDTLTGIVRKASKVLVWGVVATLLLREVGVDIAPILAGAGILGLAVGFGAQNLVRDVISGFFMILENHVRTGDIAVINGTAGLVESISLRTIVLRDETGTVHVFQNGAIATLANRTKGWSAIVLQIGVAYREDPDEVMRVMQAVADALQRDAVWRDRILERMEVLGVESFGDSAVDIKARLKTVPGQQFTVGREYRRRLKAAFEAADIEIPFPHVSLYTGSESTPLRVAIEPREPA